MTPSEMLRNGDLPQSVAYWQTRTVYWNGEPVTVSAPQPINPPSAEDGS